jgi:hypothetical protein
MAFWSNPNLREPLRQNRWYITFGDNLIEQYVFALKECSKPEYKIETTSHVLLNHTFNYPKNLVWQPITIKMVSARDKANNLASVLQARLDTNGYVVPYSTQDQLKEQNQLSKELMSKSMDLSLYQVDANGARIEEWKLYNPMITNVNYGSLSYENDGFVDISFTITYDYAEWMVNADTGINANIRYVDNNGNITNLKLENAPEEQVNIAARGLSKENEEPVRVGTPGFPSNSSK